MSNNSKLTTEQFIFKAKQIHGDKYDYSITCYKNSKSKLEIICPKHGKFLQTAFVHLKGGNCLKCIQESYKLKYSVTNCEFTSKSSKIHNNKYDYSKTNYINAHQHVIITCPKHGDFEQTPTIHLNGSGCPKCAIESRIKKNSSNVENFISKSKNIHGNKYDYSKVDYTSATSHVIITCFKHGDFEQTPNSHLNGSGCPECSKFLSHNRLDLEDFIKKSNLIHNNKYDYSKSVYVNQLTKIEIICESHGSFWQAPTNHYKGQGCPTCSVSVPHSKIINFLNDNNITYKINDRIVLDGLEIDIWLPNYNFGIEVNGCYWHGTSNLNDNDYAISRHVIKYTKSIDKNVSLYQFWDYEILNNFDLICSMINYKIGKSIKVDARKCDIKLLDNKSIKDFVDKNHLQSHRNSLLNYCLVYDNKIVSILSMSRHHKYEWEIIRYCSDLNLNVRGGFTKLLKRFILNQNPKCILTFADCRISTGNLYKSSGFRLVEHTKPNYFYYKSGLILSRQKCQKHKLFKILDNYNPTLTESQNMWNNGFTKVYDAGHLKLLWEAV